MKATAAREFIRRYRMMHFQMNWPMPSNDVLRMLFIREAGRSF